MILLMNCILTALPQQQPDNHENDDGAQTATT